MKQSMLRMVLLAALVLAVGFLCTPATKAHAGASPWEAVSLSVGLQERWLTNNPEPSNGRALEAAGNAALGLTPHVAVTGGLVFGFTDSYVRGQADARITATDATDPTFNVWVGAGRYFSRHETDGLNEWAGKAGIGWRPLRAPAGSEYPSPFVVGVTSAYGLDTGRRSLTAGVYYAFKVPGGAH